MKLLKTVLTYRLALGWYLVGAVLVDVWRAIF